LIEETSLPSSALVQNAFGSVFVKAPNPAAREYLLPKSAAQLAIWVPDFGESRITHPHFFSKPRLDLKAILLLMVGKIDHDGKNPN
jgi:hypothetical protein